MSKSNRIIVAIMMLIIVMATLYIGRYVYEISRLVQHYQQEGWYEIYDTKNNQ